MADNVAITAGSGTTIAADDIGGVLHQRVKISQGADGSATDVSSAAPLQVTLANTGANTNKLLVTPDLPSGAATAAKQPALGTAGSASADVLTVQGKAAMTPLLVDGSGVTQPVSGTVTETNSGSIKTDLDTISGAVSSSKVNVNVSSATTSGSGTATGALRVELPTNGTGVVGLNAGSAIVGKVGIDQTTPGTTNAVSASNLPTTVDTNSGSKSASTLRVVLATDQPALTNKLLVTPDANSAVNVAQMNGATVTMGNGAAGTGVQRVTLASDSTGQVALAAGSALVGNVKIDNGTQTADTFAGDSGQNAIIVAPSRKDSGSQVLNTSNYGAIDVSNYSWVTVQCTAYTSGTLTWQCSNDNSTWVGLPLTAGNALATTAVAQVLTGTATGLWHGPLTARYFRVTGGVATIYVSFFSQARGSLYTSIYGNSATTSLGVVGNKTNNNAAPGATNAGALTTIANAAAPTWSEGNMTVLSTDLSGNVRVAPMAATTGGASFLNIAAGQATTTVKSGAGTLYAIVLNSAATATNTTTIYDNTAASGTKIGIPTCTGITPPTTISYGDRGLAFATGLTIITATANGSDMTVIYK